MKLAWICCILGLISSVAADEVYTERLTITPLRDGKVHSNFDFNITVPSSQNANYRLLPPVLNELMKRYQVSDLTFTLSAGRWMPDWSLQTFTSSPPSGLQAVVWLKKIENATEEDEKARWEGLIGALGGLFCAGVLKNGMGIGESSPSWAYKYPGKDDASQHSFYHTHLPRLSATCTESLTPFIQLLPCPSSDPPAGISSLLNPHKIFDGDWTLISFHASSTPTVSEFNFRIGVTNDPVRQERLKDGIGTRDFSLEWLFGRGMNKTCPVASVSDIRIRVPLDETSRFQIIPEDRVISQNEGENVFATFDVKNLKKPLNVEMRWLDETLFRRPSFKNRPLPPIEAQRILTGHSQERGKLGVSVTNNLDRPASIIVAESWPWWVRGFISGVQITSNFHDGAELMNVSYTPALARIRPTTLQLHVKIQARTTTRILIPYESVYLWYTEYPSDAHRGMEVPGATVVLLSESSDSSDSLESVEHLFKIHTSTTLLNLPTPDFSMPYNVIILTSTVIALFFGSVFNPMVRKWYIVDVTN